MLELLALLVLLTLLLFADVVDIFLVFPPRSRMSVTCALNIYEYMFVSGKTLYTNKKNVRSALYLQEMSPL